MRFDDFQVRDALQKRLLEEVAYAILPMVEEDLKMEPGSLTNSVFLMNEQEFPVLRLHKYRYSFWTSHSWHFAPPLRESLYIPVYSLKDFPLFKEGKFSPSLNIRRFLLAFFRECWCMRGLLKVEPDGSVKFGAFQISLLRVYSQILPLESSCDKQRSADMADAFEYALSFQERNDDKIERLISPIIEKWRIFLEKEYIFRDEVVRGIYHISRL